MNVKKMLEEVNDEDPHAPRVPTIYGEREFYVQFSLTNPSTVTCTVTDIRLENTSGTQCCVLTDFVPFEMQPKQTYILVERVKIVSEGGEALPEQGEVHAISVTCNDVKIQIQL